MVGHRDTVRYRNLFKAVDSVSVLYRICGLYLNVGSMNEDISKFLEKRLGRVHAKLRLGIEAEHEAQVFGQGINFFHIENLRSSHFVIPSYSKVGWTIWARLQKCDADPNQT